MKSKFTTILIIVMLAAFMAACATDGERKQIGKGAGVGAAVGGAIGLALGAATGDAGFAVAGAAAGAAVGAGSGAMYEYDQTREDRRTQTI